MKYCFRCAYEAPKMSILKRHLNRKNLCSVTHLDISREYILSYYDQYLDDFLQVKEEIDKPYFCEHEGCDFRSKYKQNLNRHEASGICQPQPTIGIDNSTIGDSSIVGNHNYNHTDNSQINVDNSIDNSQTHNINNVNNFGCETMSHISFDEMIQIGECPPDALINLIKAIHFGKEPKNNNVKISNLRANYGQVKNDQGWTTVKLIQLLDDIFVNNCNRFIDFLESHKNDIPARWYNAINTMLDKVSEEEIKYDQKNKIKYTIYDNS